jgi:flagellar biosynthetic protein FliR
MSSFLGLPVQVYHAGLIFLRVGAMVMLLPAIGEAVVPPRIRLALALLLSLCLGPIAGPTLPAGMPATLGEMGGQIFKELFIGLLLGGLLQIMQTALDIAGEIMAIQTTLAFSQTANPNEARPGATLASFLGLIGVALIFATNMHHMFIGAIARSYTLFPPTKPVMVSDAALMAVRTLAQAYALGVQLAAPVIVFSIIFNLATGLIGRLMPQFQIFFAATPLSVLLGLSVFMMSLGMIGMVWLQHYQVFLQQFA